jgi:hypothetical protein
LQDAMDHYRTQRLQKAFRCGWRTELGSDHRVDMRGL